MIRDETAEDHKAVRDLLIAAFGGDGEARLVDALRADGDQPIALVAEHYGVVAGFIAMSHLREPADALALAPLAVNPQYQGTGVGSALVEAAIARARTANASLIFVLGDTNYYQRFGFLVDAAAAFDCAYAGPHFMALRISPAAPGAGAVVYSARFSEL